MLPALISGAASVANSLIGNAFNRSQVSVQNAFNSRQAQVNRSWQERLMLYNNWYNSPVNQMRMMRDAGYSPAMIAGQVSPMAAESASGAQASSSGVPNYTPIDPQSGIDAYQKFAQAKLAKGQLKTEDQLRTGLVRLQGVEYQLGLENARYTRKQWQHLAQQIDSYSTVVQTMEQNLSNLKSQKEYQDLLNSSQSKQNAWIDKNFDIAYKKLLSDIARNSAETSFVRQNEQNLKQMFKMLVLQTGSAALDFRFNSSTFDSRKDYELFKSAFSGQQFVNLKYANDLMSVRFPFMANPSYQATDAMLDIYGRLWGYQNQLMNTVMKFVE